MGSGISLNNKQALEIIKAEVKHCIKIKKDNNKKLMPVEADHYIRVVEFFRNHDKKPECNPMYYEYRNSLVDYEYDRLSKMIYSIC